MGSVVGVVNEETPKYEVLKTHDNYELRRYAAGFAIETKDAEGKAFGSLASYIGVMSAPQNEQKEQISMTAPVVSIPDQDESTMKMQFILPSANSSPPTPTNPDVKVIERPPQTMVVQKYTGGSTEADAKERVQALAEAARKDGYEIPENLGAWEWRRFNPPWTIGYLRTNEVCIPVPSTPVAEESQI